MAIKLNLKILFRLIPYESIRHFSAQSAGHFDRDSELELIFCTPWLPTVSRDFRAGQVDIVAVQNLIASKCLGKEKRLEIQPLTPFYRCTF